MLAGHREANLFHWRSSLWGGKLCVISGHLLGAASPRQAEERDADYYFAQAVHSSWLKYPSMKILPNSHWPPSAPIDKRTVPLPPMYRLTSTAALCPPSVDGLYCCHYFSLFVVYAPWWIYWTNRYE